MFPSHFGHNTSHSRFVLNLECDMLWPKSYWTWIKKTLPEQKEPYITTALKTKKYNIERKKNPTQKTPLCYHADTLQLISNEWVSHVMYEWVMSCKSESCPVWMSHITLHLIGLCVMSYMSESCPVWMSPVRSNSISLSRGPHVTYEKWSRVNASCHIWVSQVTYEWVMSRMNESCHIRWTSDHLWEGITC